MHKEILTEEQVKLLPLLRKFSKDFGLVGGTAIALYLGHRRSIDFDMFSNNKPFNNTAIRRKIKNTHSIQKVFKDETGQYTFFINGVQMTFYQFPFLVDYTETFEGTMLPNLLTLAAMKAFALGGRNKWKDYVDLYFILKNNFSINEISKKAKQLFAEEFNERIFRNQLAYFEDINYAEQVEFMPGFEVVDETIKKALVEFSIE